MRHPHVIKWGNTNGIQSKVNIDSWGEALATATELAKRFKTTTYIYTHTFGGLKLKCTVDKNGVGHF